MGKIVYPVTVDGVDLNSITGLTVLKTNPYQPPRRTVALSDIIRTDKSRVTGAFYTERNILVRVELSRDTRAQMEQSLDALMTIIQGTEKNLILPQSGGYRKYIATFSDSVIDEETEGGSYLALDLIFACSDRFGYDLAPTLLLSITTPYTSQYRSDRLTFGGSAKWQAPVITITLGSVTGGTGTTMRIGNENVGQMITITRNWAAGDLIVVDSYNKSVTVNGAEVEYTGAIPEFGPGFGYWSYFDTFSTRSITGNITNVNRYV